MIGMNWNRNMPWVFAHRGASGEAPENTLASFRQAILQQCDVIELDIHLTSDGHVVVCHDETLDRTTDRSGAIAELTLEEIRRADAGSWFDPAFAGERIPLLQEVLELVPAEIGLNIELKMSCGGRLEEAAIKLLRENGRLDSVLFSSYDHKLLHRIKQQAPEARISLVYDFKPLHPLSLIRDFGLDVFAVSLYHGMVEQEDVEAIRKHGKHVIVWTVNQEPAMRRMLDCGVSGIITDHPALLKS